MALASALVDSRSKGVLAGAKTAGFRLDSVPNPELDQLTVDRGPRRGRGRVVPVQGSTVPVSLRLGSVPVPHSALLQTRKLFGAGWQGSAPVQGASSSSACQLGARCWSWAW